MFSEIKFTCKKAFDFEMTTDVNVSVDLNFINDSLLEAQRESNHNIVNVTIPKDSGKAPVTAEFEKNFDSEEEYEYHKKHDLTYPHIFFNIVSADGAAATSEDLSEKEPTDDNFVETYLKQRCLESNWQFSSYECGKEFVDYSKADLLDEGATPISSGTMTYTEGGEETAVRFMIWKTSDGKTSSAFMKK